MMSFARSRAVLAVLFLGTALSPVAASASDTGVPPYRQMVPLSLEHAVQLAVSRSFRTSRAERNAEMSKLRHANARAAYRPRVDLGLSADQAARSYVEEGVDYDPYANRNFRGGLNSNIWVPVDISGTIRRQVGQAEAQREISEREIEQAKLDVAFDAQNNYLNALRAQESLAADERMVEEIKRLLEASRAEAPGVAPFLEVELGNAQQALNNSRNNADQAQDGLKQTLRMPLDIRLQLTTEVEAKEKAPDDEELLERALRHRPDVQQADLRVRQAEVSERQVGDSRRPSMSLNGYFHRELIGSHPMADESRRISNRGVGVNLKVPLFQYDSGQLGRQKEIAGLQKTQAMADKQELQERVAYDLRQAQLALERAEHRIANLPNKTQAHEALKRAERQMLGAPDGQAQSLLAQVSNARNAWRSAETARIDALIEYNRALFRLKRTLGDTSGLELREAPTSVPTVDLGSL